MTCKCGETGVYNEVLGLGFYYCRTCKIEIQLEVAPGEDRVEFDREYDTWLEQQQRDACGITFTYDDDPPLFLLDTSGTIVPRKGYTYFPVQYTPIQFIPNKLKKD